MITDCAVRERKQSYIRLVDHAGSLALFGAIKVWMLPNLRVRIHKIVLKRIRYVLYIGSVCCYGVHASAFTHIIKDVRKIIQDVGDACKKKEKPL